LLDQDDPASFGIRKMFIELALFVAVVAAIGATIVKVYEWRQNVLYGPYGAPRRRVLPVEEESIQRVVD
jgi:hypothetical protein